MNPVHPALLAGFVALFVAIGGAFLAVNLIVGSFVRPRAPNTEKLEVYECGEPTIGSSFVQFDLRFYVVALLFIIFDVEVALFFPWATVFGKATQLADPALVSVADGSLTPAAEGLIRELGVQAPVVPALGGAADAAAVRGTGSTLAWMAAADMAAFFFVLLVGFAYVWFRGDLDWVRAVSTQRSGRDAAAGG